MFRITLHRHLLPSPFFGQLSRLSSSLPPHLQIDYTAASADESLPTTRLASVAVVGPPNAGKSSLSNAMIGARVSAVSRKINTTRGRTSGAYTENDRQLIFWDTPGLIEKRFVKELGEERKQLVSSGWGAAADADLALVVVDASRGNRYLEKCAMITDQLIHARAGKEGMVLVLNKCDQVRPRPRILIATDVMRKNITEFDKHFADRVFMTSAYNGRGVQTLRNCLLDMTSEGDFEVEPGTRHCDEDLDLIRQHIWEKLLHRVHEEVPYHTCLENESFLELPDGSIYVSEVLRVRRPSAMSIVIGPRGSVISWIRETAEQSVSEALGRRVHLKLVVKVSRS